MHLAILYTTGERSSDLRGGASGSAVSGGLPSGSGPEPGAGGRAERAGEPYRRLPRLSEAVERREDLGECLASTREVKTLDGAKRDSWPTAVARLEQGGDGYSEGSRHLLRPAASTVARQESTTVGTDRNTE